MPNTKLIEATGNMQHANENPPTLWVITRFELASSPSQNPGGVPSPTLPWLVVTAGRQRQNFPMALVGSSKTSRKPMPSQQFQVYAIHEICNIYKHRLYN